MARRKVVASTIADTGNSIEFAIYNKPAEDGVDQDIAERVSVAVTDIPETLRNQFALLGFAATWGNRYQRLDNPSAADIHATFDKFMGEVRDGTWTPGRSFDDREPSDIERAIAEATGQTVAAVQKRLDEEVVRDKDGNPVLDKRQHIKRVWNKRALDNLANDDRIKPILARLAAERAKRLASEAKSAKPSQNSALDAFAPPAAPVAEAAE